MKILIVLTILMLPWSFHQAMAEPVDQSFVSNDHVHIPTNSGLTKVPNNQTSGMHSFIGSLTLRGEVKAEWYEWRLDDERETRLAIHFYPMPSELDKLPLVLYPTEPLVLPRKIELGFRNQSQEQVLETVFGATQSRKILKSKINQSIRGELTLSGYQTFVECDRRYFLGDVSKFKAQAKPYRAKPIHRASCGG